MDKPKLKSNPVITFLNYVGIQGDWMIDFDWGMSQLHHFISLSETLSEKGDLIDYFRELKNNSLRLSLIDAKSEDSMATLDDTGEIADYAVGQGIAHIRLSGSMFLEDGLCHYGMNTFAANLRKLESMRTIKGVILSVNSGGGQALAGQKIYTAVADFSKPLIAHVEMAASAAYLGILGADRIIGEGTMSMAGSIGVMTSIDKQMVKILAEAYDDIYSDLSPGKNKDFREYLQGDNSLIKERLNTLAADLQNKVKQHRPIGYKSAETLEGGMFIGTDAKKRGLFDSIGGLPLVIKQLKKLI